MKPPTYGNCFQFAYERGVRANLKAKEFLAGDKRNESHRTIRVNIVHGIPLGNGGFVDGWRYWHGWVEIYWHSVLPDGTVMTRDAVLSENTRYGEVSVSQYRTIGQIAHTWSFRAETAGRRIREFQHYGPWITDYETVLDRLYPSNSINIKLSTQGEEVTS